MRKSVVQVLKKARALIAKGWCKSSFAINEDGDLVSPRSRQAVRFCPLGAMQRAAGGCTSRAYIAAAEHFRALTPTGSIIAFNDAPLRKRGDVLRLFDEAIRRATKAALAK